MRNRLLTKVYQHKLDAHPGDTAGGARFAFPAVARELPMT